jgi:hypothetical protein
MKKFELPTFELYSDENGSMLLEEKSEHYMARIVRYNMETKNKLIRKALILQGWTPPGGLTEEDLE